MKLQIKSLNIVRFKGIVNLSIAFNHVTNIFGENAAGKTTVFDAFTWLFFDKDSNNRTGFEIKPLDNENKPMQKVDVEVSAIIDINGQPTEIKKILREKWTKKRGEAVPEFTGNENLYFWNDVPMQLKQFEAKVGELLQEGVFKLITNPLHFNGLKWQERRSVLLAIAGPITNEDMLAINSDFKSLVAILSNKSLEEYKRETSMRKKKLRDELDAIPTRIDEINRQMPESADFDALRETLIAKEARLIEIDESLQDATKVMEDAFKAKRDQQTQLHELKTKADNLKREIRSRFADASNDRKNAIADMERELSGVKSSIAGTARSIDMIQGNITPMQNIVDSLREEWIEIDASVLAFDENQFNCPACKRPLDADKIESSRQNLIENFNTSKANKLAAITQKANDQKLAIEKNTAEIGTLKTSLADLQIRAEKIAGDLDTAKANHQHILANAETEFNNDLAANAPYQTALAEITSMEELVSEPVKETDNSNLKSIKQALVTEMDTIKRELTNEERIRQSSNRVEELQADERQLAQQLADIEGSEYLAEQFTKAKMDTMVTRINKRFKYVTFKMFEKLQNGGEVECCETLVPGPTGLVPFSDANNAARVNAGLDIINTLCEHYQVYAPIFIDNRESVNKLIECESQVVNLIVSNDKKLRVA